VGEVRVNRLTAEEAHAKSDAGSVDRWVVRSGGDRGRLGRCARVDIMNHAISRLPVLWCRMTGRHRGLVDYTDKTGPYWMCDRCGEVVR